MAIDTDPWNVRAYLSTQFDLLIGDDFDNTPMPEKIGKLRTILIDLFRHAIQHYQEPTKVYTMGPAPDDLLNEVITDEYEGVMSYDFAERYFYGFGDRRRGPLDNPAKFIVTESQLFIQEIKQLTCELVRAM